MPRHAHWPAQGAQQAYSQLNWLQKPFQATLVNPVAHNQYYPKIDCALTL